tara:strand:- start:1098 stop:1730 length:633 start_codon:yes stop_codon:yes gene_type:complete
MAAPPQRRQASIDAIVCAAQQLLKPYLGSDVAIKPTIYKLKISLSDLNRDIYDSLNLTIARHPSETMERMMVRVLAFCLNTREQLLFCKGLSDTEEPDLWAHSLDGNLELWIDVGEPAADRVKKSSRVADQMRVYCFNNKAPTWWQQNRDQLSQLTVDIYRFEWEQVQALAAISDRGMDFSITLSGDSVYVASELGECELKLETLQENTR